MNDPLILMAFVLIYLVTGVGLLALAGGFTKPRLQYAPARKPQAPQRGPARGR